MFQFLSLMKNYITKFDTETYMVAAILMPWGEIRTVPRDSCGVQWGVVGSDSAHVRFGERRGGSAVSRNVDGSELRCGGGEGDVYGRVGGDVLGRVGRAWSG